MNVKKYYIIVKSSLMTFNIVAIILLQYVALILLQQSFDQVFLCVFVQPFGAGARGGIYLPQRAS